MGAWGVLAFDNDTANDWASELEASDDLSIVESAFRELDEADYLDADVASIALAACEVIARLQGRWGLRNAYSEELDQWIEANPTKVPQDVKDAADSAIERILGPDSELPELRDEGGRNDAWHNAIDDLRNRVRG